MAQRKSIFSVFFGSKTEPARNAAAAVADLQKDESEDEDDNNEPTVE
jgi:hypothetical protein